MKSNLRFMVCNVIVILVILGGIEWGLNYLLDHPERIPNAWVNGMRGLYMEKERKVLQFLPECAEYDDELFYKLRSGDHRFANREFDTQLIINQNGFRDDALSMNAPRIICLGDSYTMGWGVEDSESFPTVVEQKTGMRTLNTGVSSYGSVREFKVLSKLEMDSLSYLIIQYDMNDNNENVSFFHEHNYKASSKASYEKVVREHSATTRYYPFKLIAHFVNGYFEVHFGDLFQKEMVEEQESATLPYVSPVDAFLNLLHTKPVNDSVTIILFQVGDGPLDVIIDPLREKLANGEMKLPNPFYVLDMQSYLKEENYYLLDRHLKPEGHKVVANVLASFIQQLEEEKTRASAAP